MAFVYIVRCADGSLYVGCTEDVEKRVHAHNYLKSGARYTKARRPVSLVYKEECDDLTAAKKREWVLKQLTRKEKLTLCGNSIIPSKK